MNFKHLIDLVSKEKSRIYVVDESGEVKLVIMGPQELVHIKQMEDQETKPAVDPETVNREILEAQLHEDMVPTPPVPRPTGTNHISHALSEKAKQLFKSVPYQGVSPLDLPIAPQHGVDLRSEVIDPSFDFDAPPQGIEEI